MPPKPFTPSLLATFKKRFYPEYTHNRSVIWRTREELLEYERALQLQELMSTAELMDPDSEDTGEGKPTKLTAAKQKMKAKEREKEREKNGDTKAAVRSRAVLDIFVKSGVEALWDACCVAEAGARKLSEGRSPELERFQCGHILTRLVSKASAACGPLKQYDEELRLLNKLLSQKFWRRGKHAEWYRRRALVLTKKNDKHILKQALEGIEEALHDPDTHLVLRPDLFERYRKLEKRLKIPPHLQIKVERELREPVKVRCTGHRVHTTTHLTANLARSTATATTALNSPTGSEKENMGATGGSAASGSMNAELTDYYRKVPVPVDPEKEEAARLIAEAGAAATRSIPRWIGKSRWRGEGGGEVTVEEFALQFYAKRGYNGFHSETRILTTLFALLFWDIIFSNVPGAFETRFQAGPLDLAEDSFYYARKDAIEQRLREIEAGHARKLVERNDKLYRGRNTLCVGVRWDVCKQEELVEVVECLKTETLITICRLFCEDYAARARGVPDLFVWDYEKRECKFVEVKGPGDRPSETQKLWFDTLLVSGADVEICSVIELTFRMVNGKKRKMKGAAATAAVAIASKAEEDRVEVREEIDEDEYLPDGSESDQEDLGEYRSLPPPPSPMRLRSATLTRNEGESVGDGEGEGEGEKDNGSEQGVLSASNSQPTARSPSLEWRIPEEFDVEDAGRSKKKRRTT